MPYTQWTEYYKHKKRHLIYPESFIVRILLSTFPQPLLSDRNYKGRKILDLSCGFGRNLGLLLDLGFKVFATEISDEVIRNTQKCFPEVEICKGRNTYLPFEHDFFDYLMACNSCYYLETDAVFADNLYEISRVLKVGGFFYWLYTGGETLYFRRGRAL